MMAESASSKKLRVRTATIDHLLNQVWQSHPHLLGKKSKTIRAALVHYANKVKEKGNG